MTPYIIFALPRSRTAWLSQFLSYGDWTCGHDQLRYMRSLDDVKAWLSLPYAGTCETGGAPFWRLLAKYVPDTKVITVRRPVDEVMASLAKAGAPDSPELRKVINSLDRKLDQIEGRMKNVRSIRFEDLKDESTCSDVFEHCLPHAHDPIWWKALDVANVQINFKALARYSQANLPALNKLIAQAKQVMLTDLALKPADARNVVIREETFEETFDDHLHGCHHLFREHCVAVGEHPDNWINKNTMLMRKLYDLGIMQIMVARSNGKAFGYLMTLICPSLEAQNMQSSQHTLFYASPDMPGLGMKLQRASLAALKKKGVAETFMRAGIRGNGDRMDIIYKRLGGQDFGRMFRVGLEA